MARTPMTKPPIPDPSIVVEVIRLADRYAAARKRRYGTVPVAWDFSRSDCLDRDRESIELFDYLRPLSDECLAGLYALYRLGEGSAGTLKSNMYRYACSYYNANQPHHHPYAAQDLAAKGPLADGLRRGLQRLGFRIEPHGTAQRGGLLPTNPWSSNSDE